MLRMRFKLERSAGRRSVVAAGLVAAVIVASGSGALAQALPGDLPGDFVTLRSVAPAIQHGDGQGVLRRQATSRF